jgi:translocation and assembly module TamB
VQSLLGWLGQTPTDNLPATSLRLSGLWSVALDQHLNGSLHLERSDGDWQIFDAASNTWQGLEIQTLLADWQANHDQMQLQATLQSNGDAQRAIDLQFSASTEVTPTVDGLVIKKNAPLQAMLKAHLPQLNWLNKLLPDTPLAGQLSINAQAHGRIAQPTLQGNIQGSALSLQVPSQGVWLEQGTLNATLAENQVQIQQLHFAGKSGALDGTGVFQFNQDDWQLDAALQLDQLQALSRVDRWVQLSGQTKLSMNSQQTAISGSLKIHKGLFELPKADKPSLDEDVVIETPQPRAETASKLLLQSFAFDFGDKPTVLPFKESEQFMLRGQGLNAAVSGKLQLNGLLEALSATGTLDLTGTYLAYGQSLNIETGRLIFSGKLPNIGLDVLATRQVDTTKVGIQINGSLQTPRLKLVSTPETSNENKVSLLVLGQPMSQVGSSDLALLSVAAGALLSQGDSVSLQTRMAQAVGLDSINVSGSGPTNYAVSVGKRINRNLVVGYEKSIVGLLNVGKLTYQLTKRISIETRTGSENALDVFYGFSFD